MPISARWESSAKVLGKSRDPRRRLRLESRGALESGLSTDVVVLNVSTTGLLVQTGIPLAIDERIEIDLPQAGATWAKVIWNSGRFFGCQFETPISAAALSAAELQGDAVPEPVDASRPGGFTPVAGIAEECFGDRLRRLRTQREMTQAQLASEIGVSKPTIWAWEQERARPVESRLESLADALGVSLSELLAGGGDTGLQDLLARTREQIARAAGTRPRNVKIMIEL